MVLVLLHERLCLSSLGSIHVDRMNVLPDLNYWADSLVTNGTRHRVGKNPLSVGNFVVFRFRTYGNSMRRWKIRTYGVY